MNIGNVSGNVTIENIEGSSNVQMFKAGRDIKINSTSSKNDELLSLVESLKTISLGKDDILNKIKEIEMSVKGINNKELSDKISVLSEAIEGIKKNPDNIIGIVNTLSKWVSNPIKSTLDELKKVL